MAIVQKLSVVAVRTLFEGFCRSIGFEAGAAASEAAVRFLGSRFHDHSARLNCALEKATASAWRALELALAGDSWWDRVKVTLARKEDQAFREQVSAFLRITPLAGLPSHPPEFRQQALRELRTAQKAGVLTQGGIDPQALAQSAGAFARFSDPQALLDAEWQALGEVISLLREKQYPALAHFLGLRPQGEPLLAVAVRYFFRRELEQDTALSAAMAFAQMERLQQTQENGYDALHALLTKQEARFDSLMEEAVAALERVQAVVAETHGDVKQLRATLDTVGQAVFRALGAPAVTPGEPVRKEEDIRLEVLNTLLTTPHRQLMPLWPLHQELCARDPRFYVRLAAWYWEKGEVRDHKEMFLITLALSDFEGHRDVGLALVRKLPPFQLVRVVDFIHGRKETRRKTLDVEVPAEKKNKRGPGRHSQYKDETEKQKKRVIQKRVERRVVGDFGLFRSVPRSLRTEVARYLAEREANPEWFDSTVLVARKALKRLYGVLHIKPGERAQKILFDDDPPPDSRLALLKSVVRLPDPAEQARIIQEAKIPFRVALSLVSEMSPAVLTALIDRMSPQEVINSMGMLRRHGALAHPELKLLVELKLEQARTSRKVSTLKTDAALKAVDLGEDLRQKLEQVADDQIKARGRIRRSTALLVDKSGSMEMAIDVGKHIAAMISTICEKQLHVFAFDTMAYAIESKGSDWASWKKAFHGINAGGETSVGVALELLRRRKQTVEQIVIVTDEEEYNPPFFVESFLKYRQELGIDPLICFVKVPDSTTRLEDQCKRAGLHFTVFEFSGDYYSLPNLVVMLEPPSQLDLLLEIMDFPLPERLPA
ncbi:MAG: hypothetical protein U0840_12140 [Gemmataceae bacterium]